MMGEREMFTMRGSIMSMHRKYNYDNKYSYSYRVYKRYLRWVNQKLNNLKAKNNIPYYLGFHEDFKDCSHVRSVEDWLILRLNKKHYLHSTSWRAIERRAETLSHVLTNMPEYAGNYLNDIGGVKGLIPYQLNDLVIAVISGHVYLIDDRHYESVNNLLDAELYLGYEEKRYEALLRH